MLDVLWRTNSVRSWSIYGENYGSTLKVRLQTVSIFSVSSQPPEQHVNIEEPAQYARKPPPQQRREAQRRILSVKKRKIANVETSPETVWSDTCRLSYCNDTKDADMCDTSLHTTYRVCDTPIPISCAPPAEDILVLPPISLIKLNFLPNKYARNVEYGHDLLHDAQCCNETSSTILMEETCPMVKWTHNKGIVCQ